MFNLNPNQGQNQQQSEDQPKWKADGFLNLYLPGQDGNPKRLGAIPLQKRKKPEAQLIAALEGKNAQQVLEFILANLSANYQPADGSGASQFDIPQDLMQ